MKEESASSNKPAVRSRYRISAKWKAILLTLALLLGLTVIIIFVYRDQLTPAVKVQTSTVVLLTENADTVASHSSETSELQFQASGWIEPDPWEIKEAVLTDGFVKEVFIHEGDVVTNGQLLAKLDQDDARIALAEATADVSLSKARLERAQDLWNRIKELDAYDLTEVERTDARTTLAARQAELALAEAAYEAAQLAFNRTLIRASMDGIVLERFVEPGSKRSTGMDDPYSASIVSLYDPKNLQVRVDIPIAEAGKVSAGQPTRISTALLPGTVFTGRVTRIVGQADLQRNTLQAKVRIDKPDPRMRPEILCRVEFWSHTSPEFTKPNSASGSTGRVSLWVAQNALSDRNAKEQEIWVYEPLSSTVHKRSVKLSSATREGYQRVLDGLRANEVVVTQAMEPLKNGRRVRPIHEEDEP
jgi:RND family efflux transporter MFP subunit